MSGGHFDYQQHRFNDVADEIERVLGPMEPDAYIPDGIEDAGIREKFMETLHECRRCAEMVQRVDWLLSGDDGPDCFRRRWEKEVRAPYAPPLIPGA